MNFKKIIDVVNQMHDEGIDAYIIKNTVFDILEQKSSSNVQLAVSTSIRKVADFFKAHNYEIRDQKSEILYGCIDGTNFGIATLRYITYDEFIEQVLKTDFTVNTLIMNRNEQVKDLFGALSDIKERVLVPVDGFNIRQEDYSFSLYIDIIKKLFKYDFWVRNNSEMTALFEYLSNYSAKLTENQKRNVDKQFCNYVLKSSDEALKSNLKIRYFLNIPTLYLKLRCDHINEDALAKLVTLPREQFLAIISFLYGNKFDAMKYSSAYNAITEYLGQDLGNEEIYDTAIDEWGFEVIDHVMTAKIIVNKMVNTDFTIPSFHHESVFSEVEKRTSSPWVDIFEKSPLETEFKESDFSVSSSESKVENIKSAYKNSFFGDTDTDADDVEITSATSSEKSENVSEPVSTEERAVEIEEIQHPSASTASQETKKQEYEDVYTHPLKEVPSNTEGEHITAHSESTAKDSQTAKSSYTAEPVNYHTSQTNDPVNYETSKTVKETETVLPHESSANTGYHQPVEQPASQAQEPEADNAFVQNNDWKNGSTVSMYTKALRRAAGRKNK